MPQKWVNILGDVYTGGLISLSYTLNGGGERDLSVGPDNARLLNEGDFNIDVAYDELDPSIQDDVVTIIARYDDGSAVTQDVTVQYEAGTDWSPNYSIDWSTVTDIRDVVQITDGQWELTGDGLRIADPGYDRLVVMGDESWDFFEVQVAVTPHELFTVGGGFGFVPWWNGHTDDPVAGWQPKTGWEPSTLLIYNGHSWTPHFEIYNNIGATNYALTEGVKFNFTVRVEQSGTIDRTYKMKVWEDGTPEPTGWLMNETIAFDAPATGSFGLLAHLNDVTFHDVTVTEIEGSDVIKGSTGNEILSAVDAASPLPGQGELDVFLGNGGDDVFVFGDGNTVFYDDGDADTNGIEDYAYIWDFSSGDAISLTGAVQDFVLTEDAAGLPSGTAIWLAGEQGGPDELIGVVKDVYGLSLSGDEFLFTGAA